jgi:hypothetical protein
MGIPAAAIASGLMADNTKLGIQLRVSASVKLCLGTFIVHMRLRYVLKPAAQCANQA